MTALIVISASMANDQIEWVCRYFHGDAPLGYAGSFASTARMPSPSLDKASG